MSVRSPRLVVAGVIAAAAIALPTAALASSPGAAPGKPGPSAAASQSPAASKSPAAGTPSAAASKSPAAGTPSAAASKSAAAQSQQAGSDSAMAAALGSQLGLSDTAAQRLLDQLETLGRAGVAPASPAFAEIAHDLSVSPAQLAAALRTAKQSLVGR